MNADDVAPHERLFDVLLEEACRASREDRDRARESAPAHRRWVVAAIVLLGVGLVVAIALLHRPDVGDAAPAQDTAPRRSSWHGNVIPITCQADWDPIPAQVTGCMLRLVRTGPQGQLEEVEAGTDYVGVPVARQLASLVPAISDTPFDVAAVEAPPFDAYVNFEANGQRLHGFVRLWDQPTLVLGSRRVTSLPDGLRQELVKMHGVASRRLLAARGMVKTLEDLEFVPTMAKAIRCPPTPNGTLERHLGRFQQLEHLELGVGQPTPTASPEIRTALFDELKVLPKLRHLRCSGALLDSDDAARALAALPHLTSLTLVGPMVLRGAVDGAAAARGLTTDGVRALAREIDALELVDVDAMPALLEPWMAAGRLRRCILFGDALSPELLTRLARLPTLEELGLGGIAWTDAHLQALDGSRIVRLRLEYTEVTSAGIRRLPRTLRWLDLRRQDFEESPYRTLETNLPECSILRPGERDPSESDPFAGLPGTTRR